MDYTPEQMMQKHEESIMAHAGRIHNLEDSLKGKSMELPSIENIFKPGTGTGDSMGLGGGGALGLVALLALLGRGGIGGLGGAADAGGSAVNQLTLGQIQQTLGDIKASVPLAEAQVQLALAGAQSDINSNVTSHASDLQQTLSTNAVAQALANSNLQSSVNAGTAVSLAAIKDAQLATERGNWALSQVVTNDGDKTRALIQSIDKSNDSRLITAQANEIVELRQDAARANDTHGIAINMTNNQNQNQLQFQQQQQYLNVLTNGLSDALQSIRATNQAINIGSGFQQANPSNTNTNVRA